MIEESPWSAAAGFALAPVAARPQRLQRAPLTAWSRPAWRRWSRPARPGRRARPEKFGFAPGSSVLPCPYRAVAPCPHRAIAAAAVIAAPAVPAAPLPAAAWLAAP